MLLSARDDNIKMLRRVGSAVLTANCAVRAQSGVPPRMPLHVNDSYLTGTSANYLESLYSAAEVDETLKSALDKADAVPLEVATIGAPVRIASTSTISKPKSEATSGPDIAQSIEESEQLIRLIRAYEEKGHVLAATDPLNYAQDPIPRSPLEVAKTQVKLDVTDFGFTKADLDRTFCVGFTDGIGGLFDSSTPAMTLKEIVDVLTKAYTKTVGYEYMHINDARAVEWFRERIEFPSRVDGNPLAGDLTAGERRSVFKSLAQAVEFEKFLEIKYAGKKRFGSDGGEGFLVGLDALIDRSAEHGVDEVAIAMAHRGRLNVLVNTAKKPLEALLMEFNGLKEGDALGGSYDVKYHLGMSSDITTAHGKTVGVHVLNNPSHLETANPVCQGFVRAAQFEKNNSKHRVLPVEIHGDAAVAGQGVVHETLCISAVGAFSTGGTVHVIVNNQVGFTTDPTSSRSSVHCSAIGLVHQCPIIHVNGDRPEEVHRVFQLAADYRKEFGKSIIIDFVCYRRFGHNETDSPSFTQPLIYNTNITKRPDSLEVYKQQAVADKTLTAEEMDAVVKTIKAGYRASFAVVSEKKFDYKQFQKDTVPAAWKDFMPALDGAKMESTAVTEAQLAPVIAALNTLPDGFALHKTLQGILGNRTKTLAAGKGIEWGTAEALALGTMLMEGTEIRISGQDVERATFSQRHAILHDQETFARHTQLQHIAPEQAPLTVTNSPLSEYAVLGFEVGYALRSPKSLIMWEAQFSDFANTAQIIFDQYMFSSEEKWRQACDVIISMPHGNDGNGPEHSSGRIERFMQGASEHDGTPIMSEVERHYNINIEAIFPSTPKQYFHALRRHVKRNFRKPLVIFFSKANLRAPNVSSIADLTEGAFEPVIANVNENAVAVAQTRRVVFCVGQMYFMLAKAQAAGTANDVALVRVEQLAPFPLAEIDAVVKQYPASAEIMWAQEEPKNMGAFPFAQPHLERMMGYKRDLKFAGQPTCESPATGYNGIHAEENVMMTKMALE
jgi:2-oxoglutarate dehydrogenase E1 component